ncbi:hypothetical protein [Pasteurella multocida]
MTTHIISLFHLAYLPKGWFTGKSTSETKTDIVLLLQVKEI